MELIPLFQPCNFEKMGVTHVGEQVMLVSLAKEKESKCSMVFLGTYILPYDFT